MQACLREPIPVFISRRFSMGFLRIVGPVPDCAADGSYLIYGSYNTASASLASGYSLKYPSMLM